MSSTHMSESNYIWKGTYYTVAEEKREGKKSKYRVVDLGSPESYIRQYNSWRKAIEEAVELDAKEALLMPRDGYEAATFQLLNQTRTATVVIAWIVSIWTVFAIIGAFISMAA